MILDLFNICQARFLNPKGIAVKLKKLSIAIVLSVASIGAANAQSDDVKFSVGLKAWNHDFKIKQASKDFSGDANTNFNPTAPLVSLTAKKGDYFVTFSTLLPTIYPLQGGDLKRGDNDIAIGWSFTPGYSALIGHKTIKSKNYETGKEWNTRTSTDKGAFLGLTGAQALEDRWFAYESIVYMPSMKTSDQPNVKGTFTTLEAGLGYAVNTQTQLTVGYRSQVYDIKDEPNKYSQKAKMNGLIFGVSVGF